MYCMTLQEKAKQFAQEHADELGMEEPEVEAIWIDGAHHGYVAGIKSGRKEAINQMDDIVETRAQVKYGRVAEVFEELLQDRIQIKELRDFWRNRAGLPIPEEDE